MLRLFFGRMMWALLIVFAFYNIFGLSYYHWATGPFEGFGSPVGFGKLLVGLGFLAAFLFFLWSTIRAPGKVVLIPIVVVMFAFVYWLSLVGIVDLSSPNVGTIFGQLLLAATFALGSVWSIIWRGKTGQQSVDDPDTGPDA